jgi:hypothetical protein
LTSGNPRGVCGELRIEKIVFLISEQVRSDVIASQDLELFVIKMRKVYCDCKSGNFQQKIIMVTEKILEIRNF